MKPLSASWHVTYRHKPTAHSEGKHCGFFFLMSFYFFSPPRAAGGFGSRCYAAAGRCPGWRLVDDITPSVTPMRAPPRASTPARSPPMPPEQQWWHFRLLIPFSFPFEYFFPRLFKIFSFSFFLHCEWYLEVGGGGQYEEHLFFGKKKAF